MCLYTGIIKIPQNITTAIFSDIHQIYKGKHQSLRMSDVPFQKWEFENDQKWEFGTA